MRLRYTKPALDDLKNIGEYIERRSPKGARRVRQRIKFLIDQLSARPFVGRQTDDPTIRRLATVPYPYLIFYEVADREIVIHAVRHAARDPAFMPGQSE